MSQISNNTIARIEKWLYHGTTIESAFPKVEQQYRVRTCYEFYQRWLQNKDISPRTVCRNIARRDYALFIDRAAHGDAQAQALVTALHITVSDSGEIRPRTEVEIANDVQMCNAIIKYFQEQDDSVHRHKAMVLDNAEWLMREGKKQNNDKAVGKGIDTMMKLYDDFKTEDDPQSQMPNANINITLDVTTVKRDRVNLPEEEKERIRRQYGITEKQYTDLVQNEEGTWQIPDDDTELSDEEAEDYITQRDPSYHPRGMNDLL